MPMYHVTVRASMGGDESPVGTLPDDGCLDLDLESGAVAPPPDAMFAALADATRRHVMLYLLDESPVSVYELADVLAGWRLDDQTVVGPEEHGDVAAALHHRHLPVLDDADLTVYDRDDGTVEATALAPVVEDTVRLAQAYDDAYAEQR